MGTHLPHRTEKFARPGKFWSQPETALPLRAGIGLGTGLGIVFIPFIYLVSRSAS